MITVTTMIGKNSNVGPSLHNGKALPPRRSNIQQQCSTPFTERKDATENAPVGALAKPMAMVQKSALMTELINGTTAFLHCYTHYTCPLLIEEKRARARSTRNFPQTPKYHTCTTPRCLAAQGTLSAHAPSNPTWLFMCYFDSNVLLVTVSHLLHTILFQTSIDIYILVCSVVYL